MAFTLIIQMFLVVEMIRVHFQGFIGYTVDYLVQEC